jgi:hypothetical protein
VNAKHDGAFTAKEIEEAVKDLPTYKAGDSDELKVSLSKQVALRWKRYSAAIQLAGTGVMPTAWSQGS